MKNCLPLLLLIFLPFILRGQTSKDLTVPLSAQIVANPTGVLLSWPNPGFSDILILRRLKGQPGNQWTLLFSADSSDVNLGVDNAVLSGQTYEYVIQRVQNGVFAYGYAHAAVVAPAVTNRGTVLLFIDSTLYQPLAAELENLRMDLVGDGWRIQEFPTGASATVASVKSQIVQAYNANPTSVRSVFLLGAIPIPYSGNANWDGHPEHAGAWPADSYYADVNGNWTDATVNNETPARGANLNVPGDGKFDQSNIPSAVELEVGRVDFRRLQESTFGASPTELIRRYLNKNHNWRQRKYIAQPKALVDDNFGFSGYPEAFGANGWRNAYPLVGDSAVVAGDFLTDTGGDPWLMAYGCGGGSYTSAGGIGNSAAFAADSVNAVFTMLFGSYFGDWDFETNPFMPSALASKGGILTCSWAGRPHWFYQYLASGETVGYCTKETQNAQYNNGYFNTTTPTQPVYGISGAHVALLGDPTLRAHTVAPPQNLQLAQSNCLNIDLNWTAADQDDVLAYYVYRATQKYGPYTRIATVPVANMTYRDTLPFIGQFWYQVRTVHAEEAFAGGVYINTSTGVFDSIRVENPELTIVPPPVLTCDVTNVTLQTSSSTGGGSYIWVGPGGYTSNQQSPVLNFPGNFTCFYADDKGCKDTASVVVLLDTLTPVFSINQPNVLTCNAATLACDWTAPNTPGITWKVNGNQVNPGQTVNLCQFPGMPGFQSVITATFVNNGCSSADTFDISIDVVAPTVSIDQVYATDCISLFAGLSAVIPEPGVQWIWNGPNGTVSTQQTIMVATPGVYTLTATNPANSCTATVQTTIDNVGAYPALSTAASVSNESAPGANDGAINLSVAGGVQPYTFLWSPVGATTEDLTGLPGGEYQVTVTDANDCTSVSPAIKVETMVGTGLLPNGVVTFMALPNPTDGPVTVLASLQRASGMKLEIWSNDGRLLLTRPVSPTAEVREDFDLSGLPSGTYRILMRLEDGRVARCSLVR